MPSMAWKVFFAPAFKAEHDELPEAIQDEILACARHLQQFGPDAGRPYVDTLNGSRYANMKELRFDAGRGVWRVAFAFDPRRNAILLAAGDKTGVKPKRFYDRLIERADKCCEAHLTQTAKKRATPTN